MHFPGILSLQLALHSNLEVICQLRNDWIVVLDFLTWKPKKLHTYIRKLPSPPLNDENTLPIGTSGTRNRPQTRSSWLNCHRCEGQVLFNGSILCTGVHEDTTLNLIDLNQPTGASSLGRKTRDEQIQRLQRFRLQMDGVVTAVSAHPMRHLVVCGMEEM